MDFETILIISPEKTYFLDSLEYLFERGVCTIHLNNSAKSKQETIEILSIIPPKFIKYVVLYSHYELIGKYNLKGVHIDKRNMENLKVNGLANFCSALKKKRLTVSTTIQSLFEYEQLPVRLNYALIKPDFSFIPTDHNVFPIITDPFPNLNLKGLRGAAFIADMEDARSMIEKIKELKSKI